MKVFITGISGSLGREIAPLFLDAGHEVTGYSRCEYRQSVIPKSKNLTLYLGDVRDRDRLLEASRNSDLVIHAAAMKRVECCEEQPEEAIATNVMGTENVMFAQRMNRIPKVVLVSTDKSAESVTTYGSTKFLAESLVQTNRKNLVVRYGNVLASRGSVVQSFVKSILERSEIEITDRRCTRFWWTLAQAGEFVVRSALSEVGGLRVPTLKAYPVLKLGLLISEILDRPPPKINEIGFRSREKLHETLRLAEEGGRMSSEDQSLWYSMRELKEILSPIVRELL